MHLPELLLGVSSLLFSAINLPVKPWISRKLVHIGTGTLLLNADISDPNVINAIYTSSLIVVTSTTLNGIKHISKGRTSDGIIKDIGIFSYVLACSMCLLLEVPYSEMSPLFYADPAGAIFGRTIDSQKLYENKTLAGTSAVLSTAIITSSGGLDEKLLSGVMIMFIELFGGKIDNALIASFLFLKYFLINSL
tara:strand:+ start:496 stop:1074 length:579 start_codon:yes stop_codon:yes gene_type:complete